MSDHLYRVLSENKHLVGAAVVAAVVIKAMLPLADGKQNFVPLDPDQLQKLSIFSNYIVNKQQLYLYTHTWANLDGKQPVGVIYLIHGFGEHIHRYQHVADYFNSKQYIVIGYDHQGHGQSQGDRTYVESFDDYIDDAIQFVQHFQAKDKYKSLPSFMYGHSMGGLISLRTAQRAFNSGEVKLNGVILSAPAIYPNPAVATPLKRRLGGMFSNILPKMVVNKLPIDTLSTIETVRSQYMQDRLNVTTGMLARWAQGVTDHMDAAYGSLNTVDFPFIVLHGTNDHIVDIHGSKSLYDEAKTSDKTIKLYEGQGHEVHNDTQRAQFLGDILDWMSKHNKQRLAQQTALLSPRSPASHT